MDLSVREVAQYDDGSRNGVRHADADVGLDRCGAEGSVGADLRVLQMLLVSPGDHDLATGRHGLCQGEQGIAALLVVVVACVITRRDADTVCPRRQRPALDGDGCLRRAVGESRYRLGAQQADAVLQGGIGRTVLVDGCHVEGDDLYVLFDCEGVPVTRRARDADAVLRQVNDHSLVRPPDVLAVVDELEHLVRYFSYLGHECIFIHIHDDARKALFNQLLLLHDLDLRLTRRHHRVSQAHAVEHPQLFEAQPPG